MLSSIFICLALPFILVWWIIKAVCCCVDDNTKTQPQQKPTTPSPYDVDEYYNYWGYIDNDKKY